MVWLRYGNNAKLRNIAAGVKNTMHPTWVHIREHVWVSGYLLACTENSDLAFLFPAPVYVYSIQEALSKFWCMYMYTHTHTERYIYTYIRLARDAMSDQIGPPSISHQRESRSLLRNSFDQSIPCWKFWPNQTHFYLTSAREQIAACRVSDGPLPSTTLLHTSAMSVCPVVVIVHSLSDCRWCNVCAYAQTCKSP